MDLDNDLERLLSTQKEKHPDIEIRNSIHALLAKKKKKKTLQTGPESDWAYRREDQFIRSAGGRGMC